MPDARGIADELMKRGVKLQLGSTVHDPTGPISDLSEVFKVSRPTIYRTLAR